MLKYLPLLIICLVASISHANTVQIPVSNELKREYFLAKVNDSTIDVKERIVAIDSLLILSGKPEISLEWKRGNMAWESDMHQLVIESYEKWCEINKDPITEDVCKALYRMATAAYKQGLYEYSAQYAYRLLKENKPYNLFPYDVLAATVLAKIYIRYDYEHKAANILEKWSKELPRLKDSNDSILAKMALFDWYNAKTMLNILVKDYKQAFNTNQMTTKYVTSPNNQYAVEINKAIIYVNLNEAAYAKATLQKLLDTSISGDYLCIAINNYADILYNEGKYEEAANFLLNHISTFENNSREHLKAMMYSLLADCLAHCGKYEEAYKYSVDFMKTSQVLLSKQGEQISELTEDFERDLLKKQSYRLEEDNRKKSKTIIWMIITLSVMTALIGLIVWKIRSNNRKNLKLENELSVINDQHTQDKELLKKDLETNGKALIANAIKLVHLQSFCKSIEDIIEMKGNNDEKVALLRKEIGKMNIDTQIWEMFDKYFSETHPAFFQKLLQAHPNLTQSESRMCAFMIMNLSGKEIALLTNRSIRTVDVIKYRLRKKLDIDEPTINYLLKFV